ncbi:MlaD family protein [Pararhodobacter sp. SW119]|uniref:MlaD family protein n=1 Tax=Pararhodobacter sp. SW119 TaxID=2780075 RepID=UPI001ADF90EB|nr:MlaD family protein [Pararhodobacter sp. SW119]
METRANYVLIGAFALAGFIGLLAFLLVFARIELDRQFDYYEVRFSSVAGLSRASEVRFAGLPVGQVVDVRLASERDGSVLVRLEVGGDVPVRTDSEATIEMMGVTGVSYVGISAGSPEAPILTQDEGIPEIPAGRSVLQTLTEDAPEILAEALTLVRQVSELFDASNQQKVQNILDNLERSSEELSQALIDFAGVSQTVGQATADIAYFTTILEPVVEGAEATLLRIDTALETYTALGARAIEVLEEGDEVLLAGQRALEAAGTFLETELPVLVRELTATSETAQIQIDRIGAQAEALMAGFTETGTLANERLAEVAATIAAADAALAELSGTMATVSQAAESVDTLIAGESTQATLARLDTALETYTTLGTRATEVLNESDAVIEAGRRALVALEGVAAGDAPELIAELIATSEALRSQVDQLGGQAQTLMAELQETGVLASARLRQAEATLTATDTALAGLSQTLDTMERAAGNFDTLITGEATTLVSETRAMISDANEAVEVISRAAQEDLPSIVADIRGATETANRVIADVGSNLIEASVRFDDVAEATEAALAQVTATFARANTTLEAVDRALVTGERTLEVAERAFAGAERVIDEEIGTLTADLRATLDRLDGAVARVSEDIPEVSASLRAAAASAEEAFAELGRMVSASGGPVRDFTTRALPQFTQLARETRTLITNLDRLTRQIERNPARFFLGSQAPEFRR